MTQRARRPLSLLTAVLLVLGWAVGARAQDKRRHGGELLYIVAAEPPSFDAHREETFAMLHPGAPQYNTLLRTDPTDKTGTKFVGDLAESWTISADKRTYTFKVRQGVKFDDKRVRRALSLALDRYEGSKALSRIALVKEVAGIQVPGTPWATPPEELAKLAGYGRDIAAARAEARRLLKEAGQENLSFTLTNRGVPPPYEPVGVWLIDQWRQIGVNVKQVVLESAAWLAAQKAGDFEVSTNAPCNSIVEPDMDLHWFLTTSPVNFRRHKDTVLDDLCQKQSRTLDPEERRRLLRQFEKRLYDEEVHFTMTFQWHRIVPHSSKVRGWSISPSHFLNQQLDTVWLAE